MAKKAGKPTAPAKKGRAASFSRLMIKVPVAALVEQGTKKSELRRTLGPMSLTLMGIGGIIGTGIFVLTGVAARDFAGPSIVLSYLLAGIVAALAALAYAEMASMIPVSGSAYTYAYAGIGELMAWVIGWDLILEYAVGAMAVAIGWSGYMRGVLESVNIFIPEALTKGPLEGGIMNVLAFVIVLAITILLVVGIKESASVTNVFVFVKLIVIAFVIILGAFYVNPGNWTPFYHQSTGFFGAITAAGVVFFAYIGFDALSTTAEETRNPKRDLPIGIIASLAVSTVLYILASAIITGLVPYEIIDRVAPYDEAFKSVGLTWAAVIISVGAAAGITSVLIVLLLAQPRIFYSMARDGLLPKFIARVHGKFRTPYISTIITGVVVATVASIMPIRIVAGVTSIGTLFAFFLVAISVIILRYKNPEAQRGYVMPFFPYLPALAALGALGLMVALEAITWIVFLLWFGLGLILYAGYGYYKSRLAHPEEAGKPPERMQIIEPPPVGE